MTKTKSVVAVLLFILFVSVFVSGLQAQTTNPTPTTPVSGTGTATAALTGNYNNAPTYFSITGARANYYQQSLTETTMIGARVTNPCPTSSTTPCTTGSDTPAGLWTGIAIDATPRSTGVSSAALRAFARMYIKSIASNNVIVYANIAAGATTSTASAVSAASSGSTSSLLGNFQGGLGFVWRVCHTFNKSSKVNCIADFDYELNAVSSQAVQPIVGVYLGLAF